VARYAFSEFSVNWLKENRFRDEEIDQLQDLLNKVESKKKKEAAIKLPEDVTPKVSALLYLMESITDAEGRPICFEDNGLIDIPDEAREHFDEDLELEELERVTTGLKKVKFARRYSYPRRRGTMKENEKFGAF